MRKTILVLLAAPFFFLIAACENSSKQAAGDPPTADSTDLKKGQTIAQSAQQELAKNLTAAMQEGGAEHALEFCHTAAMPLTDSMAKALDAGLKRVTDKARNPSNLANPEEMAYIKEQKARLEKGEPAQPKIIKHGDRVYGYYPIITNQLCLQCHGGDADLNAQLKAKLMALYPADQATGYAPNQVRGAWVVDWEKHN